MAFGLSRAICPLSVQTADMVMLRTGWIACVVIGLLWQDHVLARDRLPVCAACHDTGAGGAPRIGRAEDWAPRLKKGLPKLITSVRHGVAGTLMASDTCDGCTDAEISALIRQMSTAKKP